MQKGLIHLYCGDGKGKTTAAMGLCVRAAGHGYQIGIAQFLKSDCSGELNILSQLSNAHIFRYLPDVKFTTMMNKQEREQAQQFYSQLLNEISIAAKDLDVLLLDEAVAAVTTDMLDLNELLQFLHNRPKHLEVILTGRNPPKELIDIADYISELNMIRHPYSKGIHARKGIEW